MDVNEVRKSLQLFGWPDYVVFVFMLTSCAFIGIYFAMQMRWDSKKKKNISNKDAEDAYLVGGRNMKLFPITMSLISSFISGITLLGTPTEIYLFGVQYLYIIVAFFVMGVIMCYLYLPVFHEMQIISTYQYLDSRFDQRVRLFGSVLFIFGTMLWLPIVIYVPALAFNQATGVNIHYITPMVSLVCIFYTCVGGLKAVVWTDVVQTLIMFAAMLLIVLKGSMDIGGPKVVFQRAYESGRLELPNFTFDLTERYTVYSLWIGGIAHWLKSNAINQNMIQRYLSLPTLKTARFAVWGFIFGVTIFLVTCGYCGLLIYATYSDCDPLKTKLAQRNDQLLPLLVMQTLGNYPGLPGLFVAGVFSAALSSLSTGLNSMSAVILEDFCKSFLKKPLSPRQTAYVMRFVVVIFGAICIGLVFIVEKLGTVLQLSISLSSVANGPLLGIFTSGVMIPWIEQKGILVGGISSLIFMAWLCICGQRDLARGVVVYPRKPLTTEGCNYTFTDFMSMSMLAENTTDIITSATTIASNDSSFSIFRISYLFYTILGASLTIVIALIVSFVLGPNKLENIDPKLTSPFLKRWLEKRKAKLQSVSSSPATYSQTKPSTPTATNKKSPSLTKTIIDKPPTILETKT